MCIKLNSVMLNPVTMKCIHLVIGWLLVTSVDCDHYFCIFITWGNISSDIVALFIFSWMIIFITSNPNPNPDHNFANFQLCYQPLIPNSFYRNYIASLKGKWQPFLKMTTLLSAIIFIWNGFMLVTAQFEKEKLTLIVNMTAIF